MKIAELRQLLRTKFPQAHQQQSIEPETIVTGLSHLDHWGVPKGALAEVVSEKINGCGLLLHTLLTGIAEQDVGMALIDGANAFDPASCLPSVLERVLWVRCREVNEAIKATDLLLQDGNLPMLLLDLQGNKIKELNQLPASVWYRLQTQARKSGVTALIFTAKRMVPCAQVRWRSQQSFHLSALHELRSQLAERAQLLMEPRGSATEFGGGTTTRQLQKVG